MLRIAQVFGDVSYNLDGAMQHGAFAALDPIRVHGRCRHGLVHLSKAWFTAGLQCPKRLFLEVHAPELGAGEKPGRDALVQAGIEVGALARRRHPGGVLVGGEGTWEDAVAATLRLVADPSVPVIFEGAFEHAGARTRADVLVRVGPRRFELVEVKAAARIRGHHQTDVAFQMAVIGAAGVELRRAGVLLLDREYVHPGGPPDLDRLFAYVDLTDTALAMADAVRARLAAMCEVSTSATVPAIATGAQCLVPYRCPFFAPCHRDAPAHPVTDLPRLTGEQLAELQALGIDDIRAVPADLPSLTPMQRRARRAVLTGRPVREPALVERLAAVALPAHFVDFETFAPAVPVYPGTRPFEQVPFQWSDHVRAADGSLTHREFLHAADGDPRRAFAESLLAATADAASLVVYSSFEADVLTALATQLPDCGPALLDRRDRIVDLLPLVRDHCYHSDLRGSFSIKRVLPAFVPTLGYDDLVIRDGLTASASHALLVDPAVDPARRAELRRQLLAYCARDTLAMVELHRVLGAPIDAHVSP